MFEGLFALGTAVLMILFVLGVISPKLGMMKSRMRVLAIYGPAVIIASAIFNIYFIDRLEYGTEQFEKGHWDSAIGSLEMVKPEHEHYDSAQALLTLARQRAADAAIAKASAPPTDPEPSPLDDQEQRARAKLLKDAEDYQAELRKDPWSRRYVHARVNVRKGPGTEHPVVSQLDDDDIFYARSPKDGWVPVSRQSLGYQDGYVSSSMVHPAPGAPPFATIRAAQQQFTSAQWNTYRKQVEGSMIIDWMGWVSEVNDNSSKNYEVMVDMDPPGGFSVPEITLKLPRDQAMRLRKNQKVRFSGTIEFLDQFMGVVQIHLKNAEIH